MTRRAMVALAVLGAQGLVGCGSSSLTTAELRTQAARICKVVSRQTARIPTPASPSGGEKFFTSGIAALEHELVGLRRLRATAVQMRTAVGALAGEVSALRFTLKGLRAGNDPVIAIKTLQQQLAPLELRSGRAWQALGIPACVSR